MVDGAFPSATSLSIYLESFALRPDRFPDTLFGKKGCILSEIPFI
jgi:hypothetical protein